MIDNSSEPHSLDYSKRIHLQLETNQQTQRVTLRLSSPTGRVASVLTQLMEVQINGSVVKAGEQSDHVTTFLPEPGQDIQIKFKGQPFISLQYEGDENWRVRGNQRLLTTLETRLIGRDGVRGVHPLKAPAKADIIEPITDLHTHLSAQLNGRQLVKIGADHNALYPVEILKELGIEIPAEAEVKTMERRVFLPKAHLIKNQEKTQPAIALSYLSEVDREKLAASLDLDVENQNTFGDLEECYFRREPFTKNKELLKSILWEVGHDYQRHGVSYAELSTNAITDPGWLDIMGKAVEEIEEETGVRLRFLAGMPRNLSDEALQKRIGTIVDMAKDSPYVCGVDWLGYESNKTSHIEHHIRQLAEWTQDNRPDWVQRIHAGENSKNQRNVAECLNLVKDMPWASFRIGHATFGITDETLADAAQMHKDGYQFIIETLIDSNIANNTIDSPHDSSVVRLASAGVPVVISSDGGGIYGTDAFQSARAAVATGMTSNLLGEMRKTEGDYILLRKQQEEEMRRRRSMQRDSYEGTLPKALVDEIDGEAESRSAAGSYLRPVAEITELPHDKRRPILIVGNQGDAWENAGKEEQARVVADLRALILGGKINPKKHYLVLGRLKDEGLGREVLKIVSEYNARNDNAVPGEVPALDCYVLDTRPMERSMPEGVTGFMKLQVPLVSVPGEIIRLLKEQQVEGEGKPVVIAAGGHAFTRDMILSAEKNCWPIATLDMAGASREKGGVHPKTFIDTPEKLRDFGEYAKLSLLHSGRIRGSEWQYFDREDTQFRGRGVA